MIGQVRLGQAILSQLNDEAISDLDALWAQSDGQVPPGTKSEVGHILARELLEVGVGAVSPGGPLLVGEATFAAEDVRVLMEVESEARLMGFGN